MGKFIISRIALLGLFLLAACAGRTPPAPPTPMPPPVVTRVPSPTPAPTPSPAPAPTPLPTPDLDTQRQLLLASGAAPFTAFPVFSPADARLSTGPEALAAIRLAVWRLTEALAQNGVEKVEIPQLAKGSFETPDGVELVVRDSLEGEASEGAWQIEAKGFQAGGWGVFVKGPDGLYRVILPEGETSLEKWLMSPTSQVDIFTLSAQRFWGELKIIKVDGAKWTMAQADPEGKVLAVLNPAGEVDQVNSLWLDPETGGEQNGVGEALFESPVKIRGTSRTDVPSPLGWLEVRGEGLDFPKDQAPEAWLEKDPDGSFVIKGNKKGNRVVFYRFEEEEDGSGRWVETLDGQIYRTMKAIELSVQLDPRQFDEKFEELAKQVGRTDEYKIYSNAFQLKGFYLGTENYEISDNQGNSLGSREVLAFKAGDNIIYAPGGGEVLGTKIFQPLFLKEWYHSPKTSDYYRTNLADELEFGQTYVVSIFKHLSPSEMKLLPDLDPFAIYEDAKPYPYQLLSREAIIMHLLGPNAEWLKEMETELEAGSWQSPSHLVPAGLIGDDWF